MIERYIVECEDENSLDYGWIIVSSSGGVVYDSISEIEAKLICAISNDLLASGIKPTFDDVVQDYRWLMFVRIEELEKEVKTLREASESIPFQGEPMANPERFTTEINGLESR